MQAPQRAILNVASTTYSTRSKANFSSQLPTLKMRYRTRIRCSSPENPTPLVQVIGSVSPGATPETTAGSLAKQTNQPTRMPTGKVFNCDHPIEERERGWPSTATPGYLLPRFRQDIREQARHHGEEGLSPLGNALKRLSPKDLRMSFSQPSVAQSSTRHSKCEISRKEEHRQEQAT